jgi:hydrogenase maturation protease
VLAGLGSVDRRDDGAGPLVAALASRSAESACDIGPLADPMDLLGLWDGADLVIVVDAVRSGAVPGTLHLVELDGAEDGGSAGAGAPAVSGATSTHGIGLAGVLRLARAVGQAPRRVVVVGIEGAEFGFGDGLSPQVAAAVPEAVRRVVETMEEVGLCARADCTG